MKDYFKNYLLNYKILSEDEIELLVKETEVRTYVKDDRIPSDKNCFLVLKGCVREYIIKEGVEKTTAFFLEGDSLIPIKNEKNERFWQVTEDCILTVSNQEIEKRMCELIPRLQSIILEVVQNMSGSVKEELATFISSSPEERYLHLIESKPQLFQMAPQHQIASYIGVAPESLSRLKKRMKTKF